MQLFFIKLFNDFNHPSTNFITSTAIHRKCNYSISTSFMVTLYLLLMYEDTPVKKQMILWMTITHNCYVIMIIANFDLRHT